MYKNIKLELTQVRFGRFAVFREACFLPLVYIHTESSIASAEKTLNIIFIQIINKNTKEMPGVAF